MKKKICPILLACCLLLTACEPAGSSETASEPPAPEPVASAPVQSLAPEESSAAELSERAQSWVADINYLKISYKQYHKDPFYLCTEEELNWKLDQLVAKVDDLTDYDIYFELAEIIAGMGDIHTAVTWPDSMYDRVFPVFVQCFGNRLYLSGYLEGYEEFEPYLLREIVAMNGVDITYLMKKAAGVTAPTNGWRGKELFSSLWCFIPAFFDWTGCNYQKGYTLQILNENQEVESMVLPVISWDEYVEADGVYPETWDTSITFMPHASDWTEYFEGENGGYVYLSMGLLGSINGKPFFQNLFEKTAELIKTHSNCGKLVIDLRFNSGGKGFMVDYIREDLQLLKELSIEQVYVITGGRTASAGIICLSMFQEELGAVHIGEPTGQFTSFFCHASAAPLTIYLPQSQISVEIATGWYDGDSIAGEYYDENGKLYKWENTVLPDVYVYQDIEDIRQGKDNVIEWVLAQ